MVAKQKQDIGWLVTQYAVEGRGVLFIGAASGATEPRQPHTDICRSVSFESQRLVVIRPARYVVDDQYIQHHTLLQL